MDHTESGIIIIIIITMIKRGEERDSPKLSLSCENGE